MSELVEFSPHDPRWQCLIEQDPAATIFHHPAWMEVLAASYGYRPFILAVTGADGQVRAGLPLAEIRAFPTARRFVALPFSDYCTPLYRDEAALLALASGLAAQQRAGRLPRLEVRAALPELPGVYARAPFVLHTVALECDPAQVAKRAHRQQIQNAHTAEKNGVRVERGVGLEAVGEFYRLHSLTRRKHGVPVQPWKFFRLLREGLLEKGHGFVLLAYQGETCISAGLFLHWGKTLTYKYSATAEASQALRPNHLVTWTAMEWGCQNGFTTFDFGRADLEDEGLRAYKRRWGAAETPLSYSYIAASPPPEAHGEGRLGGLLKGLIRRSPVWVGQTIGGVLYRYAG